jgi:hypothetical protein
MLMYNRIPATSHFLTGLGCPEHDRMTCPCSSVGRRQSSNRTGTVPQKAVLEYRAVASW